MMPGSLPPDPRADENVWPAARSEQRVWQPPSPKKPQPIPYTREQYHHWRIIRHNVHKQKHTSLPASR